MCPPKVSKRLTNVRSQTTISFSTKSHFDISRDATILAEEARPAFAYSADAVAHLVSAVQGSDEDVRKKFRVLNTRNGKVRALIDSLQGQIDKLDSNAAKPELCQKMIQELAEAMDPASRHRMSVSMFDRAFPDRPVRTAEGSFTKTGAAQVKVDALLTRSGVLSIVTDEEIWQIDGISADQVQQGKELQCSIKGDLAGKLKFTKVAEARDPQAEMKLNFKQIVNAYDFSFVDIALSIPSLTVEEANGLLACLTRQKFLSAYLRAKVCELLLRQKFSWPDMIGRFIETLDPEWVRDVRGQARELNVRLVISKLEELKPEAKHVLAIALEIFDGMKRGDVAVFLWTVMWHGVFMNKYLGRDSESEKVRSNMSQLVETLKGKPEDSQQRSVTRAVAEKLIKENKFSLSKDAKKIGYADIFANHSDEIAELMKAYPGTKREASPLYFPLVLEIQEALESPENDYYGNSDLVISAVGTGSDRLSDVRSVGSSKSGARVGKADGKKKKANIELLDEGSGDGESDHIHQLSEDSLSTGSHRSSASRGSKGGIRQVSSKASGVSRSSAKKGSIQGSASHASGVTRSDAKKGSVHASASQASVASRSSAKGAIREVPSKASQSSKKAALEPSSDVKSSSKGKKNKKESSDSLSSGSSDQLVLEEEEMIEEEEIEEEAEFEAEEEEEEIVEYEAPEEEEFMYDIVSD